MTLEQKQIFSEPTVVGGLVEEGTTAVERRKLAEIAVPQDGLGQVFELLKRAIDSGVTIEALKELKLLVNEEQDRKAAREFAAAFAKFQSECPTIDKNATSKKSATGAGARFDFSYASLDHIAEIVTPILSKHGLSFSWDSAVDNNKILCTCILRHANGHKESAKFETLMDSALPIGIQQKHGAALSYARRYSLIQVLGLTTTETDADGDDGSGYQKIDEEQLATLLALMEEVKVNVPKFLEYVRVTDLASLPQKDYKMAVAALEAKRRKAQP